VYSTSGWEQQRAQTRLALVRAAAQLFREQGYVDTTVEDIALRAGSSSRTFFRYFGAKEDVVFANTEDFVADFKRSIADPIPGLTRWDQIRLGLETLARRTNEPSSGVEDGMIAVWLSDPAITKRLTQMLAELERAIADAFAQERGVDPESDLAIQLLARGATAGCMAVFHVHVKTGRDLEELLEESFRMIEGRGGVVDDILRGSRVQLAGGATER
jgi:AcrR family transcriptional regulator